VICEGSSLAFVGALVILPALALTGLLTLPWRSMVPGGK